GRAGGGRGPPRRGLRDPRPRPGVPVRERADRGAPGPAPTARAARRPRGLPRPRRERVMTTMTMAAALNAALADSLAADEDVLLIGEDIGTLGGVFRITDGLKDRFGASRVIDSPLAESGIVGTSVGMAYA